jgi:uncharacterized membrane protein
MERQLLFIHIVGAVIFLGNIVVTFFWKIMANRSQDLSILAWSQGMVNKTDRLFTALGAALLGISGYAYAAKMQLSTLEPWLLWAQITFYASATIWALLLLPIQHQQTRLAADFIQNGAVPDRYWKLARWWNIFGTLATLLPLASLYLMVTKPVF